MSIDRSVGLDDLNAGQLADYSAKVALDTQFNELKQNSGLDHVVIRTNPVSDIIPLNKQPQEPDESTWEGTIVPEHGNSSFLTTEIIEQEIKPTFVVGSVEKALPKKSKLPFIHPHR